MKTVNELAEDYASGFLPKVVDESDNIGHASIVEDFTAGFKAAIEQLSQGSGFREFFVTEAQRKIYVFNDLESADQCAKKSDALYNSSGSCVIHVIDIRALASVQAKLLKAEQENERLRKEVEILRQYGNKDCTAMADEALKGESNDTNS